MATFLQLATPYARMGIPVFPLLPKSKLPPSWMTDFPFYATTHLRQIKQWSEKMPDANLALLGRDLQVGDIFFLEFDCANGLEEAATEMSQPIPQTRIHLSGRRFEHWVFGQTERSLMLGNRSAKRGGKEWFSLRMHNRYVLGPGSIHPETGNEYLVQSDIRPIDFPDWLCDWIEKHAVSERAIFGGDLPQVDPDFDFAGFREWLPFGITQDGAWYIGEVCPGVGRKHEHSTKTGIYFDGSGMGWKCFAQNCPCAYHEDGTKFTIGDLIGRISEEQGPYEGVIWPEESVEELIGDFAESADATDGMPESEPKSDEVPPPPLPPLEPAASSPSESPTMLPQPQPAAKTPFGSMPEGCLYGYLGEMARRLQCPLGYAYPALLAVYASRWTGIQTRTIRQNLYVTLLGDTSTGKTRTMDRAMSAIGGDEVIKVVDNAIGSGEGLVEALGGKKEKDLSPLDRVGLPVLLHQDEMRELMGKIDIQNSSLPYKLNRLWEKDDAGGVVKGKSITAYANASFLGGLTVESPAEFAELFGNSTVSGLYVRMLYGWAPEGWEFDDRWEEHDWVPTEVHPPNKMVKTGDAAFDMKRAWEAVDRKIRGQRLSQYAMRIALVTAAANGDQEITEECMRAALLFCEWQEALRSVYKPSRADTIGGKMSEAIMEHAWRTVDATGNYSWFSWREAYQKNSWYRKDGRQMGQQRDALIKTGMLVKEDDPEHPKRLRLRASKWSK
jgi:hypothetical protein